MIKKVIIMIMVTTMVTAMMMMMMMMMMMIRSEDCTKKSFIILFEQLYCNEHTHAHTHTHTHTHAHKGHSTYGILDPHKEASSGMMGIGVMEIGSSSPSPSYPDVCFVRAAVTTVTEGAARAAARARIVNFMIM